MEFLEKNLEEIIHETPNEILRQRGLIIWGKKFRQVHIGNYGRADLISLRRTSCFDYEASLCQSLQITVYELKQNKLNVNAFMQALKYMRGIQRYFEQRNLFTDITVTYKLILIGREFGDDHICYITNLDEYGVWCDIYLYNYSFDGIKFTKSGDYYLIHEGFGK